MKEGKGLEPVASLRGPSGLRLIRPPSRAKCPRCLGYYTVRLDGEIRRHFDAPRSRRLCLPPPPPPPPETPSAPRKIQPLGNATKPLCHSCGWPDHLPWCTYGMIQAVPG